MICDIYIYMCEIVQTQKILFGHVVNYFDNLFIIIISR